MNANAPIAKTFDKDETALNIAELMTDERFSEMPLTERARSIGCDVSTFERYMTDPAFLNWASRRLQELYKAKLPELLQTMYKQALDGKGRQQKMILDFMGVMTEKQENKSPNIVIVNNIPNPDDLVSKDKPIDVTPEVDKHG